MERQVSIEIRAGINLDLRHAASSQQVSASSGLFYSSASPVPILARGSQFCMCCAFCVILGALCHSGIHQCVCSVQAGLKRETYRYKD